MDKTFHMAKGDHARLPDGVSVVKMALGWSTKGEGVDLDGSVLAVSALGGGAKSTELCNFGKLDIMQGAVKHSGDNLTGAGDGDDEVARARGAISKGFGAARLKACACVGDGR